MTRPATCLTPLDLELAERNAEVDAFARARDGLDVVVAVQHGAVLRVDGEQGESLHGLVAMTGVSVIACWLRFSAASADDVAIKQASTVGTAKLIPLILIVLWFRMRAESKLPLPVRAHSGTSRQLV